MGIRRTRHDGSQHGLARRSGPSARLRQLSHGPEPQLWEEIWYAASCGLLAWGLSLHNVSCIKARRLPLHRDLSFASLCAVSSARLCQSPHGYLSAVDPGSRNRYRPRAAENPRKLRCATQAWCRAQTNEKFLDRFYSQNNRFGLAELKKVAKKPRESELAIAQYRCPKASVA